MTENEAIIRFDFIRCALLGGTKPHIMPNEENIGLVDAAIKALKEVQQYQALEKRLSDMFGGSLSLKMCVDELERILTEPDSPHPMNAKILTYQEAADWEAYREIGTVEECRAAVEKQTAKRALHQGCYDKNGEWHEWNGINGKPYELCPNCRANLCCETPLDIKPKYCKSCGQKLDWRNEE